MNYCFHCGQRLNDAELHACTTQPWDKADAYTYGDASEVARLKRAIAETVEKNVQLHVSNRDLYEKAERLEKKLADVERHRAEVLENNVKFEAAAQTLHRQVVELEQKLADATAARDLFKAQKDAERGMRVLAEGMVSSEVFRLKTGILPDLERQVSQLQDENGRLRKEVEHWKDAYGRVFKKWEAWDKVAFSNEDRVIMQQRIDKLEVQLRLATEKRDDLQRQLDERLGLERKHGNDLTGLRNTLEYERKQVTHLRKELSSLGKENKRLRELGRSGIAIEIAGAYDKKMNEFRTRMVKAEEEVVRLTNERDAWKSSAEAHLKNLTDARQKLYPAQQKLAKLEPANVELQEKVGRLAYQLAQAERTNHEWAHKWTEEIPWMAIAHVRRALMEIPIMYRSGATTESALAMVKEFLVKEGKMMP